MKKKLLIVILLTAMLSSLLVPNSVAETASSEIYTQFDSYKVAETEISCPVIGIPVKLTTYFGVTSTENNPFVFYVINHSGEYPGTESDVSIVNDFLDSGYIVVVVDYQNSPLAVSPLIEQSIQAIRVDANENGTYLGGLGYNIARQYVVPSGYRLKTDVVYFDIAQSAAKGTLDWIVSNWNMTGTQNKVGDLWVEAETVYDIVMKDGTKLDDDDLKLRMDIVYPSNPTEEVPMAVHACSGAIRSSNCTGETRFQHAGFLFRGYAWAVYDHEYHPFMLGENGWGHFQSNISHFSLCFHTGTETHTAAVRCLKYYADELGYSKERIGTYGISKSAWTSVLSNPTADMLPNTWRWGTPKGETYGEQPFLTYKDGTPISDDILCCYHSMGSGSARYARYLTSSNVPTLISCGQHDTGNGYEYWNLEKATYEKMGGEYIALDAAHGGHNYPRDDDEAFDFNHYDAFCKFFDYHLKQTAPEVLYTSVADGTLKEMVTTSTPSTDPWTVNESETLFIQFSAAVTEWSFLDAVKVTDGDGKEVEGIWYTEGKGTKWIFDGDLKEGEEYTVTLKADTVSDKYGRTVKDGLDMNFMLYASKYFGKSNLGTLLKLDGQNLGIVDGQTEYYRATEGKTSYPTLSVETMDESADVKITSISDGYNVKVTHSSTSVEEYNIHFIETEALDSYDLDTWLIPYWEGNIVYHESALFVGEDGAPLIYEPEHILSVRSCDLETEYIEGVDYEIKDGKLYRTENSRIPYYTSKQFYFENESDALSGYNSVKYKDGSYALSAGGAIFQQNSVFVTYTHKLNSSLDESSRLYVPSVTAKLSKVKTMLAEGEAVNIVFFGDSITAGCNSTGREGVEPYTPYWSEMVRDSVKAKYPEATVNYYNTAVPGWFAHSVFNESNATSATNNINAKVLDNNPDLLVLGFGMNDGQTISVGTYINNMKKIIHAALNDNPNCEILLIGTMLPNENWTGSKNQSLYQAALYELAAAESLSYTYTGEDGATATSTEVSTKGLIDVVPMTSVHSSLLEHKRFFDISSNNVNHPSDFLVRVYAHTVLETLGMYD